MQPWIEGLGRLLGRLPPTRGISDGSRTSTSWLKGVMLKKELTVITPSSCALGEWTARWSPGSQAAPARPPGRHNPDSGHRSPRRLGSPGGAVRAGAGSEGGPDRAAAPTPPVPGCRDQPGCRRHMGRSVPLHQERRHRRGHRGGGHLVRRMVLHEPGAGDRGVGSGRGRQHPRDRLHRDRVRHGARGDGAPGQDRHADRDAGRGGPADQRQEGQGRQRLAGLDRRQLLRRHRADDTEVDEEVCPAEGGCSCRLGAAGGSHEAPVLAIVLLLLAVLLRRRVGGSRPTSPRRAGSPTGAGPAPRS